MSFAERRWTVQKQTEAATQQDKDKIKIKIAIFHMCL